MFVASDDEFRAELPGRYDMTVRLWCWPPLGVMSRRKDPLALMAAVCAANSFILPTDQVNAFLMSSGGYRNAD